MNKCFWSCVMFLMMILLAEAQEKLEINKVEATAEGSCGATCNIVSWTAKFNVVNAAGKVVQGEFIWALKVKVLCDDTEIEQTNTVSRHDQVFMNHLGEICKHDGDFSVVSTVEISRGLKTLDTKEFVHAAP